MPVLPIFFPSMKTLSNIFKKNISSVNQKSQFRGQQHKTNVGTVFDFLELIRLWPEIIGPKMANVTEPIRISSKKLVIYTAHSAFSQQLSLMKNEILKNVKKIYPSSESHIRDLNFITKDLHFNQKKENLLSSDSTTNYKQNNKLNPFSPTYRKFLQEANELFKDIEDIPTKESLIKIYITSKDH